jgi:hypothetical protein
VWLPGLSGGCQLLRYVEQDVLIVDTDLDALATASFLLNRPSRRGTSTHRVAPLRTLPAVPGVAMEEVAALGAGTRHASRPRSERDRACPVRRGVCQRAPAASDSRAMLQGDSAYQALRCRPAACQLVARRVAGGEPRPGLKFEHAVMRRFNPASQWAGMQRLATLPASVRRRGGLGPLPGGPRARLRVGAVVAERRGNRR